MLFRERFAGRGSVERIRYPENPSNIVGFGSKIDFKNSRLASVLTAFPLL